ncbi:hypothetical protein I549_0215 [Mycobacterium avium subsp. avium 2285 (R)]|nr:hypothetical protein I549_0215 [Mycobacterium avium subsp. avium 2285 (R)]
MTGAAVLVLGAEAGPADVQPVSMVAAARAATPTGAMYFFMSFSF